MKIRYSPVSTVPSIVPLTFTICVLFLLGAFVGACPLAKPWTKVRKMTVFFAAPLNSTRIGPETVNWARLKFPPLYFSVAPVKEQRIHSSPSTPISDGAPPTPKLSKWFAIGGIAGIGTPAILAPKGPDGAGPGAGAGACAKVDVWLPEAMKNMQSMPATNDIADSVTLDITPPSEGSTGDCAVWVYHFGTSPSKQSARPQPMMVVNGAAPPVPQ